MIDPNKRAVDRINQKLDEELKELMKKHCLKDEIDLKNEGVENEHGKVLEDIKAVSYANKKTVKTPKFIMAVGQTGSGKSNLSAKILNDNRNVVKIDSDEYKAYRSDSLKIQREHLAKYAYLTGPDAYRHRDEMIVDAMEKKYNILLENAPSQEEGLFVDIDEIKQKGYNIEINVIAVSKINSLLSVHERYENQLKSCYNAAKLTSINRHNDSFDSLNSCIKSLQDKGININVYKRGEEVPFSPVLIYSSSSKENRYNCAMDAIAVARAEDERKTMKNFNNRYIIIKSQMLSRNAPIEQQEQLEQIREMYDMMIEQKSL